MGRITASCVEKILDSVRIEEVVGDFVQLKKSGSSFRGLSPFSQEKTPSFYVVPSKQIFKDFSSGKGGSAVTFLMEHEQLTYPDALRWLAKKFNVEIEEEASSEEADEARNIRE
ncbi:MAG: primase, partial [Bacteroidota bacterium]